MDNLNILVEARKEYFGQLCIIMCPAMIEVFQDMYDEATKLSKGRKTLIMYQKLLKEVPNWSNAMSKQHSDNITNRCVWYSDLLAAVFVACTKILSAVRLKSDNKKISLRLPSNEVFIQTCYNNVAKDLYKDPYVYHEEQNEYVRDELLNKRFSACIEATVKELIPVQEILHAYMTQETKNIDLDSEVHDTMDPDVFEGDEGFPEPEPEPMVEPLPEHMQEMDPMGDTEHESIQPTGLENEFKTVPGVRAPEPEVQSMEAHPQPEPRDEDIFFGDAPEQRVKKTMYN